MEDRKGRNLDEFSLSVTLEGRGSFSASGVGELVFRAFEQFREEVGSPSSDPPTEKRVLSDSRTKVTATDEGDGQEAKVAAVKVQPLPVFLKDKNPKSNPEAVAIMVFWDKQRRGTAEFDTTAINDLYRGSGRKVPANLARDIDGAAKVGWLYRVERGKWVITEYGEDHVRALPVRNKD